MTCTCFAKDYSPTRMIRELKQPRQRRQKEPRNAINFNKRDGIVVLLINRRKHIAFFLRSRCPGRFDIFTLNTKKPLAVLTLLRQSLIN